jgi:beta-lactamase class A
VVDTAALHDELLALTGGWEGLYGIAVHDLDDPSVAVDVGGTQVLPTASSIKVAILLELLRQAQAGKVDLEQLIELHADEQLGGSGILKAFSPGAQISLRDAATLMIVLSDNTATNMCTDALVGGVDAVNAAMDELGFDQIRLHNRIDFELIGPDVRRLGEATAAQMSQMAHKIASRTAFGAEVSATAEQVMAQQQYLDQVPRYFDYNPYWRELDQDPTLSVANKTGFFTGTRVDTGIVRFPAGGGFSYCVANHELDDETFLPHAAGAHRNGLIGRAVLRAWWPDGPDAAPVVQPPS